MEAVLTLTATRPHLGAGLCMLCSGVIDRTVLTSGCIYCWNLKLSIPSWLFSIHSPLSILQTSPLPPLFWVSLSCVNFEGFPQEQFYYPWQNRGRFKYAQVKMSLRFSKQPFFHPGAVGFVYTALPEGSIAGIQWWDEMELGNTGLCCLSIM